MNGEQLDLVDECILEPDLDLDLDGGWWTMVILGVVIIGVFGFCFCIDVHNWRLISRTDACTDQWRSWEMGAVLWAILFGIYYFARFPQLPDVRLTKTICALIFLGSIVANAFAAYYIMVLKPAVWHVAAVTVGSILFMAADYLLYKKLEFPRKRCSFFEGMLLADAPMVAGLVTLMAYLLTHPSDGKSHESMEAFAGGAISFQLIAANVIFILSQGGFIRWVWERHVPTYIQKVSIQKAPLEQNPWAGAALTCGLLGTMVPLVRLVDGSWSPWLGVVGLIAIVTGALGRRTANQYDGAGKGPANVAMVLGALGLTALGLVAPQGSMFFSTSEELPAIVAEPVTERVTAVALSPDGSMVARGSDTEETLKIFDARSGELIEEKDVEGGPVLALAFSPDGKTLASGGKDLTLLLWDTGNWQYQRMGTEEDRQAGSPDEQTEQSEQAPNVLCLAFSPEGRLLAGGVGDNSIRFWDTAKKSRLETTLTKHDRAVYALAFSADGKWLVSGGDDKVARWAITKKWLVSDDHEDGEDKELWDINVADDVFHGVGQRAVKSVAITRHGDTWAAGLDDGTVQVWDRTNPQSMSFKGESREPVLALRFSDDALVLASASRNPGVTLWDLQLGSQKRLLQIGGAATVMDFSRDATALAGGSDGGALTVWWAH